jgi:pectinesterase
VKIQKHVSLAYHDSGLALHEDGRKVGTFRSYTFLMDGNNNTLKNLTIENTAGFGRLVGQAIALYCDGDQILVENCRLLGHQDTLFTGPLPPAPMEPGGFTGPKEFAPRLIGKQLFRNCYIQGDIDFIFGSASAWFEKCHIHSLALPIELYPQSDCNHPLIHGYITAGSTPEGENFGYIFHGCELTGDAPDGSVYLGRPWRNYAKTLFLNCTLGSHIHPNGFHDWNKKEAQASVLYGEYKNLGSGSFISQAFHFCKANKQRRI